MTAINSKAKMPNVVKLLPIFSFEKASGLDLTARNSNQINKPEPNIAIIPASITCPPAKAKIHLLHPVQNQAR